MKRDKTRLNYYPHNFSLDRSAAKFWHMLKKHIKGTRYRLTEEKFTEF